MISKEVAAIDTVDKLCTHVIKLIAAAKLGEGGSFQTTHITILWNALANLTGPRSLKVRCVKIPTLFRHY